MNNELNLNQNSSESPEQTKVIGQEIAAAFAMGLIIVGIIYVIWRAANASGNSNIASEVAASMSKSAMSSVDIASMLNS